jgi:endonuclease-3
MSKDDTARIKEILRRLEKAYPGVTIELDFRNPLELLVATILAAQCTDKRVNEVTKDLFQKYRAAKDYARADLKTFEGEIRSTGFYVNKAKNITACCRQIVEKFGGEVPPTLDDLVTLSGVGRKTANVVLGNAFGQQAIAVDTHVLRVSRRLDFTTSKDPDVVEADLCKLFPKNKWTRLTHVLTIHGRRTCKAKKPSCPQCPVVDLCKSEDKVI